VAGRRHVIFEGFRYCPACCALVWTSLVEGQSPLEVVKAPATLGRVVHNAEACELLARDLYFRQRLMGDYARHWEWAA
jgi:hypothetical protein